MGMEKFCQSCMLPRGHELFKNGTEKNGSENTDYCKLCYENGEFTQPEIQTAQEMQTFCKNILKEQGVNRLLRWFYTCGIPNLKRWKK